MKSLIVILGPTGVGKTELCIQVAKHLNIPIINADSRQIFAELPIGTAAPTKEQQQQVKHFFVGNHHITDYYSASIELLQNRFRLEGIEPCTHCLFHRSQKESKEMGVSLHSFIPDQSR